MSDDELLTVSEVVARFRDAGIGQSDESRRSYIRELMARRPAILEDLLELPEGRRRAGRHDPRITAKSVDTFLGAETGSGQKLRTGSYADYDGRTALQEVLARLAQLMSERETDRTQMAARRLEDAARLAEQDLEIANLKNTLRLCRIELDVASEAHFDERGTRVTYENVLAQLLSPEDASTITG